jgi:hypothetical protein
MQILYFLQREGTILAITCSAVFGQTYRTRKKEKEKEIFYTKNKN